MDLVLETERLIFREIKLSDKEAFFFINKSPNVHKYLRNPIDSIEKSEEYIKEIRNQYKKNNIGRFAVVLKTTNELIGLVGLKFIDKIENNHSDIYDLGFRFNEKFWNNGYGFESAKIWIEYGFEVLKIKKIYASAQVDTIASNTLLKKLKFTMKNTYYHKITLHNWYELNKNEWI